MKKIFLLALSGLLTLGFTSCQNGDSEFDNPDGKVSVYFAYQNPVRTLVMGEDTYDTTLDNLHQCIIYAVMGGSSSGKDIKAQLVVDNSLTNKLYFDVANPTPVKPMPRNYYILGDDNSDTQTVSFDGKMRGGVKVQFTDAFFADPEAVSNNYVIPLVIKSQVGADTILCGQPVIAGSNPQRTDIASWLIAPLDYTLFCVKYISKYDANYCRRGVDKITAGGTTTTVVRHNARIEDDEVYSGVTTRSLNSINYPLTLNVGNAAKSCNLIVTFDANEQATITTNTAGVTVTGTGSYEVKGEKKSWNNKDRDRMILKYKIDFGGGATVETTDTLVTQSRGVVTEEFACKYVK
ncbi:MAG: DUF5627 domain-containing protein [Prevotellaceae bacterium]|nr:DUF5627 domain-containing protein [Prevotellaceae bacterium]